MLCAAQVFIAAVKKLVRSFCGMWRTEALVIAAHGVPEKHGMAHRLACGQADQVAQGLLTQRIGLLASQVQADQVASGGTALLLQLLL